MVNTTLIGNFTSSVWEANSVILMPLVCGLGTFVVVGRGLLYQGIKRSMENYAILGNTADVVKGTAQVLIWTRALLDVLQVHHYLPNNTLLYIGILTLFYQIDKATAHNPQPPCPSAVNPVEDRVPVFAIE